MNYDDEIKKTLEEIKRMLGDEFSEEFAPIPTVPGQVYCKQLLSLAQRLKNLFDQMPERKAPDYDMG